MSQITDADSLAAALRAARLDKGLSQLAVAALVGCSVSSVYRWEAGTARPLLPRAKAWAAALGVPWPGIEWGARCGTVSGYARHRRVGEAYCGPCRAASTAAWARWRKERR